MGIKLPWRSPRRRHRRAPAVWYQYYATVHATACEVCLRHHGEIYARREDAPPLPLHPDCRCSLLEFPAEELSYYEEHGRRMRERAQQELRRRALFRRAREALAQDALSEALDLFRESVQIDVYEEEIEALCREERAALRRSPEAARRLRDLFLRAYRWKFDLDKYRHMPEGMRAARRRHGLETIRACFAPFVVEEA